MTEKLNGVIAVIGIAQELGPPWAQALDRGSQKAAAPQRARDCACQ